MKRVSEGDKAVLMMRGDKLVEVKRLKYLRGKMSLKNV